MKERLPNVCLVMFWVVGLFVMYQSEPENELFPPKIVSHILVVPAMRWPQPPVTPADGQSSPPSTNCHSTGPVGVPVKVTEADPLSCEPPLACGEAALAKLPLMSPE